jgi:hydroxyacyl-ACP dehydratase HTD2-like protein with hotdog domain
VTAEPTYFDDVAVGTSLPDLDKGRITALHIMRWSAATENWHRIHYDQPFAREVDRLPDVLVNGSWKQQVLCQYIKDWAAPLGWLWRIRFRFHDMDTKDVSISVHGEIAETAVSNGLGYVRCLIEMRRNAAEVTTSGEAIAVLPLRSGPPVPYPFVAGTPALAW